MFVGEQTDLVSSTVHWLPVGRYYKWQSTLNANVLYRMPIRFIVWLFVIVVLCLRHTFDRAAIKIWIVLFIYSRVMTFMHSLNLRNMHQLKWHWWPWTSVLSTERFVTIMLYLTRICVPWLKCFSVVKRWIKISKNILSYSKCLVSTLPCLQRVHVCLNLVWPVTAGCTRPLRCLLIFCLRFRQIHYQTLGCTSLNNGELVN